MSDHHNEAGQAKFLDTFPTWLRSLGDDAEKLAAVLAAEGVGKDAREAVAGGLNYLFKSLDLIPDGIDDIGYLDDAFVLRVAADLAAQDDSASDAMNDIATLANDCELIREFLGTDYDRLESYVKGLRKGAARGRAVADILSDSAIQDELLSDVRGFSGSYQSPSFAREEKNLIKLRAFFDAKLPK
ncbi:MAG: DUF1232 domain-containing protein [Sandaracinaceae bacterium]